MLRELKNNNQGIILVTVLLIIFIMMIVSISIISMNVSQVMQAESEVKRIQAEILALGALDYVTYDHAFGSISNTIDYITEIGDTNFVINMDFCPTQGLGLNDTSNFQILITY